jgi:hypothetical protein
MTGSDVVWPWGMTERDPDPASRPWVFNPIGFLLAVLEDDAEAALAGAALEEAGFTSADHRAYTGEQVVRERKQFQAQQSAARRLVERVTIDNEVVQLLLDYANGGRGFLWVRVPEREDANRAIRGLSANKVLYFRYYGDAGVEELRMP